MDSTVSNEIPGDVQEAQRSREHMDVRSDQAREDILIGLRNLNQFNAVLISFNQPPMLAPVAKYHPLICFACDG